MGVGCSQMVREITYMRSKNLWRERDKIQHPSDVHDVVTHARFRRDWSKCFSV